MAKGSLWLAPVAFGLAGVGLGIGLVELDRRRRATTSSHSRRRRPLSSWRPSSAPRSRSPAPRSRSAAGRGTLATIKATEESTGGHLSLIEHVAPPGFGSPLHVHRREDEWFYVLEGELTVWVGGEVVVAPAGSFVYGPRRVPHTFAITSAGPARFLLATQPAGLDGFVRELGAPAEARALPTSAEMPDPERLAAAAARHGMDILGPPGIPS